MSSEDQEYATFDDDQGYETEGFEDQGYDEDAYADGEYDEAADEDFPEPEVSVDEAGKKKPGPAKMAAIAALAVALIGGGGYYVMNMDSTPTEGEVVADTPVEPPAEPPAEGSAESGGFVDSMLAMVGMGGSADTPKDGEGDEAKPVDEKPAKPAAKPTKPVKPAAKKPNDDWSEPVKVTSKSKPGGVAPTKVAVKPPKPKPPAPVAKPPKPKPIAVAPAKPAGGGSAGSAPTAQTSVSFASGSYWVPAAEMERLWAFSSGLKSSQGHITVEVPTSSEPNGADLARKRGDRVAELIRRNNVGSRFEVQVKVKGQAEGDAGRKVSIYYSKPL